MVESDTTYSSAPNCTIPDCEEFVTACPTECAVAQPTCSPKIILEMSQPQIVRIPSRSGCGNGCGKGCCHHRDHGDEGYGDEGRGWPFCNKTKIKTKIIGGAGVPGPMPISVASVPAFAFASVPVTLQRTTFLTGQSSFGQAGAAEFGFDQGQAAPRGGRESGRESGNDVSDDTINKLAEALSKATKHAERESGADNAENNQKLNELAEDVKKLNERVKRIETAIDGLCKTMHK
jgi:hypothetical protein